MQVTRVRRPKPTFKLRLFGRLDRRAYLLVAGAAALAVVGTTSGATAATVGLGTKQVGQIYNGAELVSSDQFIKPIGDRLVIPNGKIMADTISPDGTHLAALTTDGGVALTIVDLKNWKQQQLIGNGTVADLKISGGDVGQQGPTYSPDGKTLWVPRTNGYSVFPVNPDGTVSAPSTVTIAKDGSKSALTAQAVFSADGSTVYAAVNGQNRVVAIDAATGAVGQSWAVGNAPRGMVRVGSRLYVGDEGGRTATAGDTTINSYGTQVPANPNTGAVTTGAVSVINLSDPSAAVQTINVGLHPTTLYAKNGTLFVTNTGSDTVSVINTDNNKVVQTITTQPWPEASVGYEPDGVTLTNDGHLLVTLGRANAVAVYRYINAHEAVHYIGLLPTDYFPASVDQVGGQIVVGNTRGVDALRPDTIAAIAHQTHDTTSSVTRFKLPSDHEIAGYTDKVFQYNGWTPGSVKVNNGNKKVAPVPVPARLGDPSTIKHVFLIVKENRTYDQQFGDMPQGNGEPLMTQFGAAVTPNQHALAEQFGLYDNTYDTGTNSAEGHNWLMQADDPEYTESSAGEYLRSYDTEDDAMGHQRSGTLWSGAQSAGKSVRDFGEFNQFETYPAGNNWGTFYCDSKNMEATGAATTIAQYTSSPIPSLNNVTNHAFPKFDTGIPDQYRYEIWKQDFEANGPANLNMFWLSSDHTGGPLNPSAQVADNDLATGKIVDEISHSPYWKDSAIFVVEDDSQAGVDHVDGHRAPIQIISPYAQRGVVDSTYYSQITIVRTIEQILGIQPMNQLDSAATPMASVFTSKPNYTPFNAVPNQTSLTLGYTGALSCGADNVPAAAGIAQPSTVVPAAAQPVAAQWEAWKAQQRLTGPNAVPDYAPPAQMNRYTWYATHQFTTPYPGDSKVFAPDQVPGAYLPSTDSDN